GTTARTAMEAMIGPGDSGGGLFDKNGMLLGITSFIWGLDGNANSDYGDVGGWTNVASYYDWINCIVGGGGATCAVAGAAVARLGGAALDAGGLLVPAPASLALFGLGLGALAALRRRRGRSL